MATQSSRGTRSSSGARRTANGASSSRRTSGSRSTSSRATTSRNTESRNAGSARNSSKRKSPSRNSSRRNTKAKQAKRKESFDEAVILFVFAASLIVFLSNFGICGQIGKYISDVMFGLFGVLAYVFPIFFVATVGLLLYNSEDYSVRNKVFVSYILYAFACGAFHMIFMLDEKGKSLESYYKLCADGKTGGGFIGGAITETLIDLLAVPGTFIVEMAIILICVVIITEKSIIEGLKNGGSSFVNMARESMYASDEEMDLDRYIKETDPKRVRREITKGRGVTKNTRIGGNTTDLDMHEIDGKLDTPEIFEGKERKASKKNEEIFAPADFDKVRDTMNGDHGQKKESTQRRRDFKDINITGISDAKENQAPRGEVIEVVPTSNGNPEMQEITPAKKVVPTPKAIDKKDFIVSRTSKLKDEEVLPEPDVAIEKKEKINTEAEKVKVTNEIKKEEEYENYVLPPVSLLKSTSGMKSKSSKEELLETAEKLELILEQFGVSAKVTNVSRGPSVTRYELQPEFGTKVAKITSLSDDIKLNLAASDIRIEAPIPGKAAVGIEIPNKGRDMVGLRELIEKEEFKNTKSKIAFPAGLDIAGNVVIGDIAKMPHLLVAGTTGSGKSVFTNSIIMSVLFRARPDEVKLLIIDPKVVEFGVYNGIPHLLLPVVTDPKKAAGALSWAVGEMTKRYKKFASINVKDLASYNQKVSASEVVDEDGIVQKKLPQILIVIDELADLMMVAAKEVEESICRLAQLARAAGIHLVIATQRPSVDVVTGLIKANISSRVALLVSSGIDSRTIIDMNGAEKLLGNGDMLFYPSGYIKPVRVQGAYVSEEEILKTITYLKNKNGEKEYDSNLTNEMTKGASSGGGERNDERDEYFEEAGRLVIEKEKASTSMLQRYFRIGFNRAARIVDQLADFGVVGPEEGTKPRKVIMTMAEFEEMLSR